MKYMGSKRRIVKDILPIMLSKAHESGFKNWTEPFVGGGNMIENVPDNFVKLGSDINPHTICAMLAVRDFSNILPDFVSEEEYKSLLKAEPSPISSWIRFVCSVGGKFDGGYARDSKNRNYSSEGKRNAAKQSKKIQSVDFVCCSYDDLVVKDSIIYCDPPYSGTTGYKTEKFDHEHFFDWCRHMKDFGNLLFLSEYNAPPDFTCVWEGSVKTNFATGRSSSTHLATEKLFTL